MKTRICNLIRVTGRSTKLKRRGSAAMLIASMMFVFVVTAAFTVDFAYMQLVRTELRSTTDAAAKAGAEALARTQNTRSARDEAIRYAALNTVGRKPFLLSESDVLIGRLVPSDTGTWGFNPNGTPPNAVRVNARTGSGAAQPAVPLFFSRIVGHSGFTPSHQSTAGQQEVEVCLCLDRSGSMTFDMTGIEYSFPPGNPYLSTFTAWGTEWTHMLSPPHPSKSRWAALDGAVTVFFDELAMRYAPRTSLVTWATDYTMPIAPYTKFTAASTDLALPSVFNFDSAANATAIKELIRTRGKLPMMGGTNLAAGFEEAIASLNSANSKSYASKVIILLTDGEWNAGVDPVIPAQKAKDKRIVVHCISMLTQTQSILQSIANITGGRYYRTRNDSELRDAFRELANALPIVLTE